MQSPVLPPSPSSHGGHHQAGPAMSHWELRRAVVEASSSPSSVSSSARPPPSTTSNGSSSQTSQARRGPAQAEDQLREQFEHLRLQHANRSPASTTGSTSSRTASVFAPSTAAGSPPMRGSASVRGSVNSSSAMRGSHHGGPSNRGSVRAGSSSVRSSATGSRGGSVLSGGVRLGPLNGRLPLAPAPAIELQTVVCKEMPQGITQRIFRKAVGAALAKIFTDPPKFKTFVKYKERNPEVGTVLLPNAKCAETFLHKVGPRARASNKIMIGKTPLHFDLGEASEVRISKQEAQALRYKPDTTKGNVSDYESNDEDKELDVWVQHCEIGAWDAKGRFASAWQSKELRDNYSCIDYDGDTARLTIRLEDTLIVFNSYHISQLIVSGKDLYIESTVLPTYLADESQGYAALRRQVGLMQLEGLSAETKFIRIPALDDDHAKVAGLCYVVKVRTPARADIDSFLGRWQRRFMDITEYFQIAKNDEEPFKNAHLKKVNSWLPNVSFQLAFQAHKLLLDGKVLPLELLQIWPTIEKLNSELEAGEAAALFQALASNLYHRSAGDEADADVAGLQKRLLDDLGHYKEGLLPHLKAGTEQGFFDIHAVIITPAGVFLDGPHRDTGNRIIREYPGKEEFFLRVRIEDENHDLIRGSPDIDQDVRIFTGKMQDILLNGLSIAGRVFKFLAFSTSSLREHSTWFVADFEHEGRLISAQYIRDSIGDLKSIRTPAKFAARLGQAFTSTAFSIDIERQKILDIPDVERGLGRNKDVFSDGCGTISAETMHRLHEKDARNRRSKKKNTLPAVFQVRIGGAKGVLSLQAGQKEDVAWRPSMIKFHADTAKEILTLEVASSADAPLVTNLNRPLVALLETLGVPAANFINIQDSAVAEVREAVDDVGSALRLYRNNGFGHAAEIGELLQTLNRTLGLDGITDVEFLKKCNLTCLTSALRSIKYKARCKVDQAWTLMGIMDETGWLEEGQIFVQLKEGRDASPRFLKGWAMVGRSPYLAPGDVQFAVLKGVPPAGSPLWQVHNCVVFSQKGERPLPSCLAGGDLDGDLYNIIQNPLLTPTRIARPGDYLPVRPKELDRPCTVEDIIQFFLVYCQTDRLGMIAERHLTISDRSDYGVQDGRCIKLAQLASIAVDMQKTGIAPDLREIPRLPDNVRPDYTQSEHRVEHLSKEHRGNWARDSKMYYRSEKALGQLFRRIDVTANIDKWGQKAQPPLPEVTIRSRFWSKLEPFLTPGWFTDISGVQAQIQVYYAKLLTIAKEFAPERRKSVLSEEEVFMSVILSRYGSRYGTSHRTYNAQIALKDEFASLVDKSMSELCKSGKFASGDDPEDWDDGWEAAIITAKSLRQVRLKYPNDLDKGYEELRANAYRILVLLARWIRCAELYEDIQAPEKKKRRQTRDDEDPLTLRYQSAKWIAMAPALKKVEELELLKDWQEKHQD